MSQKSSAPPMRVPAKKLLRDIRRATRKQHSTEDTILIVPEELRCDGDIKNIGEFRPEPFVFLVPLLHH